MQVSELRASNRLAATPPSAAERCAAQNSYWHDATIQFPFIVCI